MTGFKPNFSWERRATYQDPSDLETRISQVNEARDEAAAEAQHSQEELETKTSAVERAQTDDTHTRCTQEAISLKVKLYLVEKE